MAIVHGDSGAWKTIVKMIAGRGLEFNAPADLPVLLRFLEEDRAHRIYEYHSWAMGKVNDREIGIELRASERNVLKRLAGIPTIRRYRAEIKKIVLRDERFPGWVDRTIACVRKAAKSPLLAGAEAELAVIDSLRKLEPPRMLFNDLRLRAARRTMFDGTYLRSAQIDHLVLSPAGIFVIETKWWSERFVAEGRYFDPFEQASRACSLCREILHKLGKPVPVRGIIVSFGSLPYSERETGIQVCNLGEAFAYIASFAEHVIDTAHFERLSRFFRARLG